MYVCRPTVNAACHAAGGAHTQTFISSGIAVRNTGCGRSRAGVILVVGLAEIIEDKYGLREGILANRVIYAPI